MDFNQELSYLYSQRRQLNSQRILLKDQLRNIENQLATVENDISTVMCMQEEKSSGYVDLRDYDSLDGDRYDSIEEKYAYSRYTR